MAPIILSARLRGDLEEIVLRTSSAKERCRAQAVLWLAEGVSAEQVAETFQVSRQTVYNWANRFLRREGLDLRARLLDAPRPGRSLARRGDRPLDRGGLRGRSPRVGLSCDGLDRRVVAAPFGAGSRDQSLRQEH